MLKRILIWTGISILLLVATLFIATRVFEDDIEAAVISTLNARLQTEVKTGSVDFSLFRHFPKAAVVFEEVRVMEAKQMVTTGTVLTARRISLLFNIMDLIQGRYKLSRLVVEDGSLNLQEDAEGRVNYEVWRSDSTSGEVNLQLDQVEISGLRVVYYVAGGKKDLDCFIEKGLFAGSFTGAKFTMSSEASLKMASYRADGVTYLPQKDLLLSATLNGDTETGLYTFHETRLKLDGLDLKVNGIIQDQPGGNVVDLTLDSPGSDLRAVFAFIPGDLSRRADEFNYTGTIHFRCTVKGPASDPLFRAEFNSTDTGLNPKGTDYRLTGMRFKGTFTNRKSPAKPVEWLRIDGLRGLLQGKPLTADFEVENFERPKVTAKATLDATLEVLSRFYHPDTITDLKGKVKLDAYFQGIAGETSTYNSSGSLTFSNVSFKIKGRPLVFTGFEGALTLDGGDVIAENLRGMAGSSDLQLDGVATDLAGYLMKENVPLVVRASLRSSALNLDELMAKEEELRSSADTAYRFKPAGFVNFSLALNIDSLQFRKFHAARVRGEIVLRDKVIQTKMLEMQACGGSVLLKGMIDGRQGETLKIDYDARITDLDINRLFYEMGNFGQETIIDKNLKGRVTAEVMFRSEWSDRLVVNTDKIYARSDITVTNGELNNFEPMLALSRYVKGTDLRNIRFSALTNTIEIKNRKIMIPQMEIKSSALDLTLSGTHDFDNIVDYKLQLYLSQLTGRKVKQMNTEFGTIEEDGLGRSRIFLTMTGPADAPEFKVDRKGVEQKISGEIKKEVKSIRETLRQEFSKSGKDSVAPPKEKKKQEELQIEFED